MKVASKCLAIVAVLMLMIVGSGYGQAVYVDVSAVQGLTAEGYIPEGGTDLVIPVRFQNAGDARTAISNGYRFTGDVTYESISGEWNTAYPWNWELAFPAGCYPPVCYPYFDQGTFINVFPDRIGFAGLTGASGSGLPVGFDDVACYITLTGVDGASGDMLVMDSSWWEPANYWLWSGVAENVSWNGPHEFTIEAPCCCTEVYTECWPQPTVLKALENDRILEVRVYCEWDEVDLASVRVNGIPNYLNDGVAVRDEYFDIWTNVFIMRFLGASGFRPIPPEGIQSTYTVTYETVSGSSRAVVGDFLLTVYQGDVNFDTQVNIEDAVILAEYLFQGSERKAELFGYEMAECMDVDASGRFDLLDIRALIDMVGI